jgi:hypothetical protein
LAWLRRHLGLHRGQLCLLVLALFKLEDPSCRSAKIDKSKCIVVV